MKAALSIAFSLVAGSALAHPAFLPHQHPHDWSILPGADFAMLAVVGVAISAAVFAYIKR